MRVLPPPGPERSRQITRLVVLLGVLAVVLWWTWTPTGPARPASNQPPVGAPPTSDQLPIPEPLRLQALDAGVEPVEVVRNPFVFGEREFASPPGSAYVTPPDLAEPPAPVPAVPQGPPPIPLQLTGLTRLDAGGRMLATLKDPSTNVLYQAFEGDIVDGRYRVVRIGVQSVVVSYLDGSGMRTLPLGG